MALCVQLERDINRLRFEAFPNAPLDYWEDNTQGDSSFLNLKVTDTQTKKTVSVFLKAIDLQKIGISLTTWKRISPNSKKLLVLLQNASVIEGHLKRAIPVVSEYLTPEYLTFFKKTSYANRVISNAIHEGRQHLSGIKGVPGMYFHFFGSSMNIFINLKKTAPFGMGTYGKVRKVLWLNAPNDSSIIVAKKVLRSDRLQYDACFKKEMAVLSKFSVNKGIISVISAGIYEGKFAIFLPAYECNLLEYFQKTPFSLSLDEKLHMTSQLLEGLASISKKGTHGDLKPNNLLLRRGKGIEAVISDFGTYRSRGKAQPGVTTLAVAPPEYYAKDMKITSKHDVWGMGLSLHEIFSKQRLSCWQLDSEKRMKLWTSKLAPNWILQYPTLSDTPPFVLKLINEMLDPRVDHRPHPKKVFKHFSAGYSAYVNSSKKSDATR